MDIAPQPPPCCGHRVREAVTLSALESGQFSKKKNLQLHVGVFIPMA